MRRLFIMRKDLNMSVVYLQRQFEKAEIKIIC